MTRHKLMMKTTAFDLGGKIKVRVTTKRRWWGLKDTVGIEVWVHDDGHFAYYVWKATR